MNRYSGKPLLRLIECYVLDQIDQLQDAHRKNLETMEPKLRVTFGINGSWKEIVAELMSLDDSFNLQVKEFWSGYLSFSKSKNLPVDPEEFAASFIDQNLNV